MLDGAQLFGREIRVVARAILDSRVHGTHGLLLVLLRAHGFEGVGTELERLVELVLGELVIGGIGGALDDWCGFSVSAYLEA